MATILKSKATLPAEPVIYRFEDVANDARRILDEAKAEAVVIIAEAQAEAREIRRHAEQAGQTDAQANARQEIQTQLQTLLPAITSAINQLCDARKTWLQEWQNRTVQLAVKIAERVVRCQLQRSPSITLTYVREALEMCVASPQIRVLMHSADVQTLGESARQIVHEIMPAAQAEIVADDSISPGGCRIETRHGEIDQQVETQLQRIEAELNSI